jgi:hypothetical protein
MSENKYIIDNKVNDNMTIEHFCNMCGEIWIDNIVKSDCINGCKNKGWATAAPDYTEYCPDCNTPLTDVDYGDGMVLFEAYCEKCDKIIVDDDEEYEPVSHKIIEWACIAIIGTIVAFAIGSMIF